MLEFMIPIWETTTPGLAMRIEKLARMVIAIPLNEQQRSAIRSRYSEIEDFRSKSRNPEAFVTLLFNFIMFHLKTGDYDTWMQAIIFLRNFSYQDPYLKGFLISIDTSRVTDEEMDLNVFKKFLVDNSNISYPEQQELFYKRK